MKKLTALLLLTITIWSLAGNPTQTASARPIHNIQRTTKKLSDKLVYVTKDKTYHRSCCRHMSFSNPTALSEAQKKNYIPCRICNP